MPPRYTDPEMLQNREKEILDQALEIISEQGIAALTMDKLVASVSYSKGTVYNHFSSKDDVFAGLCNCKTRYVAHLFSRAAAVEASARERMTAIVFSYLLSILKSPQQFDLLMNAKTEMFEKASVARREEHQRLDEELFGVIYSVIEDAIAQQELVLSPETNAQEVAFSLWAMSFGTIGLLLNGGRIRGATVGMQLEERVIEHGHIVMDGFGWQRNHSGEADFMRYLSSSVFAEEVKFLEQKGIFLQQRSYLQGVNG